MTKKSKQRRENEEFTKTRQKVVQKILSMLEENKGKEITITEWITRNAPSRDRHCSTTSITQLQMESVGIQFSGAQITIYADKNQQYGVSMDVLSHWEISESEIELCERYSESTERYTRIQLIDTNEEKE